jgi:hypothetical protein
VRIHSAHTDFVSIPNTGVIHLHFEHMAPEHNRSADATRRRCVGCSAPTKNHLAQISGSSAVAFDFAAHVHVVAFVPVDRPRPHSLQQEGYVDVSTETISLNTSRIHNPNHLAAFRPLEKVRVARTRVRSWVGLRRRVQRRYEWRLAQMPASRVGRKTIALIRAVSDVACWQTWLPTSEHYSVSPDSIERRPSCMYREQKVTGAKKQNKK